MAAHTIPSFQASSQTWIPPSMGTIKQTRIFHYLVGPVVIETLAAMLDIKLAVFTGWMRVLIEGDCLEVIHKFQMEFGSPPPIGHIIHNAKSKIKMLADCQLLHVR
ncbi:hypothetical protein Pfo_018175 [Paulownia fortunei]|nr:hypothetical protein Pfo_018175 [Paulownia fortunei]